jgi:cation diffusion facilitator family transporter
MKEKNREHESIRAVNLGLFANVLLALLKTAMGIAGHSPALLADGVNSTSDVAYLIVVRIFMGMAGKPPDDEHPYGHRQMESIAALAVGAFVIATAVAIFWDAINRVYDLWTGQGGQGGASVWALAVGLFTIGFKIFLSVYTKRIGRRTRNPAVLALAYDHRNDIFAASAASIGIFFGRIGYEWIDPLAGALVALVILRTGIEIVRESSDDLMDTVPGKELDRQVRNIIAPVPEVMEVEEIFAHRFGPYLVMNVTIGVEGSMTVAEGDAIASRVETELQNRIGLLKRVHVHYHPAQNRTGRPAFGRASNRP